jgi:hypothetical protein
MAAGTDVAILRGSRDLVALAPQDDGQFVHSRSRACRSSGSTVSMK